MRLYGKVENIEDIARINCIIRDEMLSVKSGAELTDLKKRSDYLCTLTYSKFWQKKFGEEIEKIRQAALIENRATTKTANYVAEYNKFEKRYNPWKKELEVETEFVAEEVNKALGELLLNAKNGVGILEDLREVFCDIRKAAVFCENAECLDKLKRGVDILSTLPYLENFRTHFDDGLNAAIDAFIAKEKERSVKLFNIIVEVEGFDRYYESIDESNLENTEEFIEKLLKEEEKAQTYIPTEMKYKGGAKVLWIVYNHKTKKREYAKRIYLPSNAQNITIQGPGEFKNRFGNKVWGIKISYEMFIKPTVIHLRGKEIKLPQRKITKTKIVPLVKEAENIRITETKPQSAMDIA